MENIALALEAPTLVGEHRRADRMIVTLPALISIAGRPHSAQLHNLSAGGALLKTRADLSLGDYVEFCCGTIRAEATIRRKVAELVAIEFVHELPEDQLREQVAREDAITSRRSQRSMH